MTKLKWVAVLTLACATVVGSTSTRAVELDWPQWRGANHDAKAPSFTAPATWPKTLAKKWTVPVGDGVATPALVGDRIYVFSRQNDNEVTRALDATTGKELWADKYPAQSVGGPASGFSGPRSSPAVADGKVVTLGVHGTISALDAKTGKVLWRKSDYQGEPKFSIASSPIIVNGLVVAQLGGQTNGGVVAFDLATGNIKWKWTGESPDYASPAVMTVGDTTLVFAETVQSIVALNATDGKPVWKTPFPVGGPGAYNSSSPAVDGQTLVYSGGQRGTKAVKFERGAEGITSKELWSNVEKSTVFMSPVIKDGVVYGLSGSNELFTINMETGKAGWSQMIAAATGGRGGRGPGGGPGGPGGAGGPGGPGGGAPGGGSPGGGFGGGRPGGGRGGRMGGGGGRGYGTIVDAGSVLMALTPASELIIFQPGDQKYTESAKLKVADTPTYAYPVLSGNRVLIKDQQLLTLWTVE